MKKSILIPALAVTLWASASLAAQQTQVKRADTLRRELTVMTEEEVTLTTRQPRDLSYTLTEPVLPAVRHTYLDTPIPFTLRPNVAPLGALSALRGGYEHASQRGYAFFAAGLPLSVKAGAGLRLLRTKTDLIDVYARYSSATSVIPTELPQRISAWEKAWRLGANYAHQFESARLSAAMDFGQQAYNYYGLTQVLPPPGLQIDQLPFSSGLRRRATEVSLSARYTTEEDFSEDWLYDLKAGVDYTSAHLDEEAPAAALNEVQEFLPKLHADVSRRMSSVVRVGALGAWSIGRLTSTKPILYDGSEKGTFAQYVLLTGVPYLLAEDVVGGVSWRALGGLRVLTGNDRYQGHLFIFPKIDARLRAGAKWGLRLEMDADLVHHSLRLQPEEAPYLAADAFTGRYERVYDAKLTASATLASALSIEAFVRYAGHKNAANYRPEDAEHTAQSMTAHYRPITFRPDYVDYVEHNVGMQLAYNHRGLLTASLRGVYAYYATDAPVLSRPTFTASALVELNMIPKLSLRSGYEFATALKSYDTEGRIIDLSQLHLLHADATYSLSDKLHLTAELRAPLLSGATRWYGYRSQPMLVQGGLQFIF